MHNFVEQDSIVRTIWGNADTVLLIFAGSAAEFALNRAVDWLFFTGKLPADPIGRLFSTVRYAQDIVFADAEKAKTTIELISAIHGGVEGQRGQTIPDWAYRDVLYILVDYSERAFELLNRSLSAAEREELYDVFRRVGEGMHLPGLPPTYEAWRTDREVHLERDLVYSPLTAKLFDRYQEELGNWRYQLLRQAQALLVPAKVRALLKMKAQPTFASAVWVYRLLRRLKLRPIIQKVILPAEYLHQIQQLERPAA